jgi:carbon-monoxide dehydrogenase medium subunit
LEEAVKVLKEHGEKAKVLAGGQSLIPLMRLRLASPEVLVDIGRIEGLSYINEEGDVLRIGAMTRHRDLEKSRLSRERYELLADAAAVLGDPEVRNMGTIGGSLAHGDPASDWGAALLAYDTQLTATGPEGTRTISIDEFFRDTFMTALEPSEVLTEIRIPRAPPRSGGAYMKLKRKTGDFATVAAAAHVVLDEGGAVARARIGLTAVGPTPVRARRAEEFLMGRRPDASTLAQAAKLAAEDVRPSSDLRGSEEYKRAMVEVYTRRALERAVQRSQEGR